jgi:hypothetical protein
MGDQSNRLNATDSEARRVAGEAVALITSWFSDHGYFIDRPAVRPTSVATVNTQKAGYLVRMAVSASPTTTGIRPQRDRGAQTSFWPTAAEVAKEMAELIATGLRQFGYSVRTDWLPNRRGVCVRAAVEGWTVAIRVFAAPLDSHRC